MKNKKLKIISLVLSLILLTIGLFRFPPIQKTFSAVKYTIDSGDVVSNITSTGIFTIGTAAVNSFLRLYPTSTQPTEVKGAMYMDSVQNVIKFFNGTAWVDMAAQAVDCPTGMISVPASRQDGIYDNFCVDKYEAKNVGGIATSQASSTPWVSITQYNARAECIRAGKHLITEQEWQAIAHNVEDVGWNWNGGVAGTNQMSDGHSDNGPTGSLAASTDDDPCSGTGQNCSETTWNTQRRTYKLSNGNYIWDFGGNVYNWVDQFTYAYYPVVNDWSAWAACSTSGDGICGNTRTTNDQRYGGATTALRGFCRGGDWGPGTAGGAFCLSLGTAPTTTHTRFGFRCAQ